MKNLGAVMKQAQQMQSRMAAFQETLGDLRIEGVAGGGRVKVEVNGRHELVSIKLDPEVVSKPAESPKLSKLDEPSLEMKVIGTSKFGFSITSGAGGAWETARVGSSNLDNLGDSAGLETTSGSSLGL